MTNHEQPAPLERQPQSRIETDIARWRSSWQAYEKHIFDTRVPLPDEIITPSFSNNETTAKKEDLEAIITKDMDWGTTLMSWRGLATVALQRSMPDDVKLTSRRTIYRLSNSRFFEMDKTNDQFGAILSPAAQDVYIAANLRESVYKLALLVLFDIDSTRTAIFLNMTDLLGPEEPELSEDKERRQMLINSSLVPSLRLTELLLDEKAARGRGMQIVGGKSPSYLEARRRTEMAYEKLWQQGARLIGPEEALGLAHRHIAETVRNMHEY